MKSLKKTHLPPFTVFQLEIMRDCPYDYPSTYNKNTRKFSVALLLTKRGILEREQVMGKFPAKHGTFRLTEYGQAVWKHWRAFFMQADKRLWV